jgi:hypothetical protein
VITEVSGGRTQFTPPSVLRMGCAPAPPTKTIAVGRAGVAGMFKVPCHQQPGTADNVEHLQQPLPLLPLGRNRGLTHRGQCGENLGCTEGQGLVKAGRQEIIRFRVMGQRSQAGLVNPHHIFAVRSYRLHDSKLRSNSI